MNKFKVGDEVNISGGKDSYRRFNGMDGTITDIITFSSDYDYEVLINGRGSYAFFEDELEAAQKEVEG